jgi:hypothetical protein
MAKVREDFWLVAEIVEECPNGYPRLAAFNASEQNFMLYRGFSCIHARLLLNLQTGIQMLERELDEIDRFHDTIANEKTRLRSWDLDRAVCKREQRDGDRTRADILEDLRVKVTQYDELLIRARELVSFQRPTNRDYRSVRNWLHNLAPLVDEEQDYIRWEEDIVTLRHGREWAGFDGIVEEFLHRIDCRLVRVSWLTSLDYRFTYCLVVAFLHQRSKTQDFRWEGVLLLSLAGVEARQSIHHNCDILVTRRAGPKHVSTIDLEDNWGDVLSYWRFDGVHAAVCCSLVLAHKGEEARAVCR